MELQLAPGLNCVYIIGAGGHAKVVISTLLARGEKVKGVLDDDPSKTGSTVLGIPIVGASEDLAELGPGAQAVIAVGDNRARKKIADSHPEVNWAKTVHEKAFVHESVEIGPGTVVFAGAIIQPDTIVGSHCIINTATTVDHDCTIGDYVHLAPGVHLAGGITVGDGAFLGIGCNVTPGIRIGSDAVVGAGSVVIRDVPDGVTVAGVPARALRGALRAS